MLPASVTTIVTIQTRVVGTLLLAAALITGLTGCGQKGALYLADTDSSQMASSSSKVLDSSSNPQDAAFAGLNDAEYQQRSDLEVMPDGSNASDDPNDY